MTALIGIVVLATASGLLRGFVVAQMWRWFFVPIGLPAIGVIHAIGVGMLISYTTKQLDTNKDQPEPLAQIAAEIVWAVLALVLGWTVHSFMQ